MLYGDTLSQLLLGYNVHQVSAPTRDILAKNQSQNVHEIATKDLERAAIRFDAQVTLRRGKHRQHAASVNSVKDPPSGAYTVRKYCLIVHK